MGGGVLVPVHRGYVCDAVGYFVVGFEVLDGCVVCCAGVPDCMVKDDGGISAAGVVVLWFRAVRVGGGFACKPVVFGRVFEGDTDAVAEVFAGHFD